MTRLQYLIILVTMIAASCSRGVTDPRTVAELYYQQAPAPPCSHELLRDRSTGTEFCVLPNCNYITHD
jgi:hypothetical protein